MASKSSQLVGLAQNVSVFSTRQSEFELCMLFSVFIYLYLLKCNCSSTRFKDKLGKKFVVFFYLLNLECYYFYYLTFCIKRKCILSKNLFSITQIPQKSLSSCFKKIEVFLYLLSIKYPKLPVTISQNRHSNVFHIYHRVIL